MLLPLAEQVMPPEREAVNTPTASPALMRQVWVPSKVMLVVPLNLRVWPSPQLT